MDRFKQLLECSFSKTISILDEAIALHTYTPLDLSTSNADLKHLEIVNPDVCQAYVNAVLEQNNATVAYGGYLEKRNIYLDKKGFLTSGNTPRDVHLGMDFWAKAGTKVVVPLEGTVHSFENNRGLGDYGPTIILSHNCKGFIFHTLYGHLSQVSLNNLQVGKTYQAGEVLATLGHEEVNGNYAPHLHFQLIFDMQGLQGDYPGVCASNEVMEYVKNCPDPNLLLNMPS